MYIASSINPFSSLEGNVPVSIFRYNGQRRFLRVSESYEDTIERVANSFRIQNCHSVLLQTSCLDACRGRNVVIDSSAYPLLWSIIYEVEVMIAGEFIEEKEHHAATSTAEAGPSRDNLEQAAEEVHHTPSPASSLEEKEAAVDTAQTSNKSNPWSQWGGEWEQEERREKQRVERTPVSVKPQKKFKAAITPSEADVSESHMPSSRMVAEACIISQQASSEVAVRPAKKVVRPGVDEDARFDVIIVGPGDDQSTQFKLRGKNSVRKVLVAACNNFDIDPHRATLYHAMNCEVDGEVQSHHFPCSPEDTISGCGINSSSKLYVKVDPDENILMEA